MVKIEVQVFLFDIQLFQNHWWKKTILFLFNYLWHLCKKKKLSDHISMGESISELYFLWLSSHCLICTCIVTLKVRQSRSSSAVLFHNDFHHLRPFYVHINFRISLSISISKEIQLVHPKGNQSWIFIGRTDAEAETPILWPPDVKNWLIWKDSDAGKYWRWEENETTEDEMVGWHH